MKTSKETGVIRINKQGAPSVLAYTTEQVGDPGDGQVVIRQKAIAVNFVDVLFRNGSFPLNHFPATIGVEGAGEIESVGKGVTHFKAGDRVGYYFSLGAYAEKRLINAQDLIKIPDDISLDQAASLMAKGLTARMLVKEAYPVQPDDFVLVHAAAGGVGSLVSRWAKALGARIIATVGNASKKEHVLHSGIEHVISLDTENLEEAVQEITGGQGVDVVYDGVGKATFDKSARAIRNGGTIVLYGTASGAPQIDQAFLASKQIKLLRPALGQYLPDQRSVETASSDLFEALRSGLLGQVEPTVYKLSEVSQAHQDLEASLTTGSIILHP